MTTALPRGYGSAAEIAPDPPDFDELAVRDVAYREIEGVARDVFKQLIPVFDEYCEALRIENNSGYEPERYEMLGWFIDDMQEHQRLYLEQSAENEGRGR